MIPDDVYVHKAAAGDDKAFEALVKRHRRKIYEVAHRMLGNPRDAESVTHATFSGASEHIKAFRGQTAFGTWIYRIAVNRCIQYRHAKSQLNVF